jgi:aldehyde:ferredoxin oxidoreductase
MARRGLALARLYNLREGFTRHDDRLPDRFSEDLPMHRGLTPEEQDTLVTQYYRDHGWDPETGTPLPATLAHLGIEEYVPAAV